MSFSIYSVQRDNFGNLIVCGGTEVRYPYSIVHEGDYRSCLEYKVLNTPTHKPRAVARRGSPAGVVA